MSGYWNREASRAGREPFTAYCEDHLPAVKPLAWQAITEREENPPTSLLAYLRRTFGGAEHLREYWRGECEQYGGWQSVREHAERMSIRMTPHGFAWTGGIGRSVGAPCAICGKDC